MPPSAIERILRSIRDDEGPRQRGPCRSRVTEDIRGLVAAGQTDQERLVVSGLTRLKSLEMTSEGEA